MSTLCPRGETSSNLFQYMFFFRLPPRIRELLGEDDHSSMVKLTTRANTLSLNETKRAGKEINAVKESTVSATGEAPPEMQPPEGQWQYQHQLPHLEGFQHVLQPLHVQNQGQKLQAAVHPHGKLTALVRLNTVFSGTLEHKQCQLSERRGHWSNI
jgi:hypothetical protein